MIKFALITVFCPYLRLRFPWSSTMRFLPVRRTLLGSYSSKSFKSQSKASQMRSICSCSAPSFDPINGLLIQSGFHCQCICAKSLFPAGGPNLFRARLYVHFVHLGYSPFVHFLLLYFPFRGMSSLFCCPYGDNVLL